MESGLEIQWQLAIVFSFDKKVNKKFWLVQKFQVPVLEIRGTQLIHTYLIRAAINPYRCVLIRGLSNCLGKKSWIWKHHGWVWPREIGQSYNFLSHFDSFPPYFQTLQKQKRACFDEKILHDYGEPWVEKMTFCRMHRQTGFPFWNPFFDEFTLKFFE